MCEAMASFKLDLSKLHTKIVVLGSSSSSSSAGRAGTICPIKMCGAMLADECPIRGAVCNTPFVKGLERLRFSVFISCKLPDGPEDWLDAFLITRLMACAFMTCALMCMQCSRHMPQLVLLMY